MTIRVLPPSVADQIAAGEVVERPASVAKELIENSIDAGATEIEVEVEHGGKRAIIISDNGSGMTPDDAERSFLRHATSKISEISDIFAVQSYGFRGEALAAISSVSRCQLFTRTGESEHGYRVCIESGQVKEKGSHSANIGTRIEIRDLFYSTPARLQYLKTEETEYRQILKEVQAFALVNPAISFVLKKDGDKKLDLPSVKTHKSRIADVFGSLSEDLIPVKYKSGLMKISGFISRPEACAKSRNKQYFFVNGRAIEDTKLNYAIRNAYTTTCGLQKDLHPVFILFIDIDPIMVDVNVHPRKKEVKFSEPQDMFRAVQSTVIKSLEGVSTSYVGAPMSSSPRPNFGSSFSNSSITRPTSSQVSAGLNFSSSFGQRYDTAPSPAIPVAQPTPTPPSSLKLIGQVANKYIIAEGDTGLYIFDQHALHERQRFERLMRQYDAHNLEIQTLLIPQEIEMSADEVSLLIERLDELSDLGFDLKAQGPRAILLKALPMLMKDMDITQLMNDFVQYFQNEGVGEHSVEKFLRIMLEYRSCRGSVKFGDSMHEAEMQQLLDDFDETQWRLLCPHGRPNHTFWSFDDLDRQFYR